MVIYTFSDRQADAVLELRLYQLTSLERDKVENEYKDLLAKIDHFRAILASEALVKGIIKDELDEIAKRDGAPRKTKIIAAEGEFAMEDLIQNEQVVITISADDYIKRMPTNTFREQRRGGQGVIGFDVKKDSDAIKDVYTASTHDTLLIFTNLGRCHWIKVWEVPEGSRRSKGKAIVNLLDGLMQGENIAAVLNVANFSQEAYILFATRSGVIKKTELSAYSSPRKKGVYAITIDEGDEVIAARLVSHNHQVMLFTKSGMAVRFDHTQVRPIGRIARGVKGVTLRDEQDGVVSCEVVNEDDNVLVVCENGFGKRSKVSDFRQTNRGGVGVRSIITSERNGNVVAALEVKDSDGVLMMSSSGQTIRTSMKDVRVMGRSTQGVKLVNLSQGDLLVAVQKIEAGDE